MNQEDKFAHFYEQQQQKCEKGNEFNIFLNDEQLSLLSNSKRESEVPNQYRKKLGKLVNQKQGLNQQMMEGGTNFLQYAAAIYMILGLYSVALGMNNFIQFEDKVFYFYDHPYLTTKYFTIATSLVSFMGMIIQQALYMAYSTVTITINIFVYIQSQSNQLQVFTNRIGQQSFNYSFKVIGQLSHLFLFGYSVLPMNKSTSPILKFEDALFLNIYIIFSMIYVSYIMYFAKKNFVHGQAMLIVRITLFALLMMAFVSYLIINALNEFKFQAYAYTVNQEMVRLSLPYCHMLLNSLFFGSLYANLEKIVVHFGQENDEDLMRRIY